jgi:phenylacetate 2-hydroxylase
MDPILGIFAVISVLWLAIKWANRTDIPKVKGLPELPGVPIFGSLFYLGKYHARNCARLGSKYGDVFQVRLGNRVCHNPF